MYYVYILQSLDEAKKQYIGYTNNLRRRLGEHNSKDNVGYTRGRQWRVVYYEAYVSESDAREREHRLKQDGRSRRFLMARIGRSLDE